MLKELTRKYIKAFDSKNIESIAVLLKDDFALEDPVVKRVEGKKQVLEAIQNIFNSCQSLSFKARNIYQDDRTTMIEFVLRLDEKTLTGTDIIEWQDDKMKELRAYLDVPK